MDLELVRQREAANDGQSVHLFYDETVGTYLAFGLSAYYTTMVVTPYVSFSNALQMPVALLRRNHINGLRQSLKKIEHTVKEFYRFQLRATIGEHGYEKWAQKVLNKHLEV